MIEKNIKCPRCDNNQNVIKHGTQNGNQRYKCKDCNITFQDYSDRFKKIKKTYSAIKFFSTLYNLIDKDQKKVTINELELEKNLPYLKERMGTKNIVIKSLQNDFTQNVVADAHNLKIIIIFDDKDEVKIYKYDCPKDSKATESFNITILNRHDAKNTEN